MKKHLKTFIYLGVCVSLISSIIALNTVHIHKKHSQKTKKQIVITLKGAVRNPGLYVVEDNENLKHVLHRAQILSQADFKNINYNVKLQNERTYYIPFDLNKKISYTCVEDIEFLKQIGLKKSQSQKVFKYLKVSKNPSWNEIENIAGIGKVTIANLKKHIQL